MVSVNSISSLVAALSFAVPDRQPGYSLPGCGQRLGEALVANKGEGRGYRDAIPTGMCDLHDRARVLRWLQAEAGEMPDDVVELTLFDLL